MPLWLQWHCGTSPGSLSASVDEATWVLTGYLISNAIVLPSSSWSSSLFGRKQYQIISISVFAVASGLFGASTSLTMLVTARVTQDATGFPQLASVQLLPMYSQPGFDAGPNCPCFATFCSHRIGFYAPASNPPLSS